MGNGCSRGEAHALHMPSETLLFDAAAAELRSRFCNTVTCIRKEDEARRAVTVVAKQKEGDSSKSFFLRGVSRAGTAPPFCSPLKKWIHYEVLVHGIGIGKVLDSQFFLLRSGRKMRIEAIDSCLLVSPLVKYKATAAK